MTGHYFGDGCGYHGDGDVDGATIAARFIDDCQPFLR